MGGGAAVTWPKVNVCRGICASITRKWNREGKEMSMLFISLPVAAPVLVITWMLKRNQPADTQGQMTLTSPASPLWPGGGLVSFPRMASVSALTLRFQPAAISSANTKLIYSWRCCRTSWTITTPQHLAPAFFFAFFAFISIQFLHISDVRKR